MSILLVDLVVNLLELIVESHLKFFTHLHNFLIVEQCSFRLYLFLDPFFKFLLFVKFLGIFLNLLIDCINLFLILGDLKLFL